MRNRIIYTVTFMIWFGRMIISPRLTTTPSFEGSYEAIAHLFVGFLILVPFYDREEKLGPSKLYGYTGWGLAFWELGWFIAQKYFHV